MRIQAPDGGVRLDVFLASSLEITRSQVASLIKEGHVLVGDQMPKKAGYALHGEIITVTLPEIRPAAARAQEIALEILYEDDDLAVVMKPRGLVVHPAAGNEEGTLVNALLYHLSGLSGIGGEKRPGIVHRHDKDTSGALVVAKHDRAHVALCEQFKDRSAKRVYLALVHGHLKEETGYIDAPIARHPVDRKRMAIVRGGREAMTKYVLQEAFAKSSLVQCSLVTGRTHQIRVHMQSIGHPLLGDTVYGGRKTALGGQLLHAHILGFIHPRSGQWMEFIAPLPPYFVDALAKERART